MSESPQDAVKRLRAGCLHLSAALSRIDCLLLSKDEVDRDTKAVGGPVAPYNVDYNEQAVVERVKQRLGQHVALIRQLVEALDRQLKAPAYCGCSDCVEAEEMKQAALIAAEKMGYTP